MEDATEHLRRLATRIVDAALERVPLRAAILLGSGGRGDADFYSDIDLLLYVNELPPEDVLPEVRATVGGTDAMRRGGPEEPFLSEEFVLDGVRTEVSFVTVDRTEQRLDDLLDGLEAIGSPLQKILSGVLEGPRSMAPNSSRGGTRASATIRSRCDARWSSGTGTSSRFGTTARRSPRGMPNSGVSTCCSTPHSTCSPSSPA